MQNVRSQRSSTYGKSNMDDNASVRSRSSISKVQDLFWDGYSLVGATTRTSLMTARSSGMRRSIGLVAKHVFFLVLVITTIVLLIIVGRVPTWQSTSHAYASKFNNCNANGTFTPNRSPTYNLWSTSGLFEITLTWGNMSFSKAKAIDIGWDIVVGRGMQAIFLYVAFEVFTMTLSRTMEERPVSYGTFEALAFTSPTFWSPYVLCRDYFTNQGARAKATVAWIIIASLFVLAFPTLNDSVSGYSTNTQAFLKDKSGVLVPFASYQEVQFVIQDGARLGLPEPTWVTDDPTNTGSCASLGPTLFTYVKNPKTGKSESIPVKNATQAWAAVPQNCTLFWHVVEYANTYGLNAANHTPSVFNQSGKSQTLPSPTLNITSFYTPTGFSALADTFNGFPEDKSSSDVLKWITDDLRIAKWVWQGAVYDLAYVLEQGVCIPLMTHNWGFSFLGIFVLLFLTAVWSIGMYIMWIDAYLNSRFARAGRDMGPYKASWDFASAMRRDMGNGAITEAMSNRELERRVRKARNGNRIVYQMNDSDIPISRWDELRIWWGGVDVTRKRGGGREKHRPTSLEPFADDTGLLNPSASTPAMSTGWTSSPFLSGNSVSDTSEYKPYNPNKLYDNDLE